MSGQTQSMLDATINPGSVKGEKCSLRPEDPNRTKRNISRISNDYDEPLHLLIFEISMLVCDKNANTSKYF